MTRDVLPLGPTGRDESTTRRGQRRSRVGRAKGGDSSAPSVQHSPHPAAGPRIGRHGLEQLRSELTERDFSIVRFVAELRLASARQLRHLFFADHDFATIQTAARNARRVLARLETMRLLRRLRRRVGGVRAGSDGYVYVLGPVGYRVVEPEGWARPRVWEPSAQFVDHHLAVTQLAVDFRRFEQTGVIEQLEIQGEPRCWRPLPGQRPRTGLLRPDLLLAFAVADREVRWFIEVDRGTAHLPAILRKCHLYERYYRSGREQAEHGIFPRVHFVTTDVDRAERITAAIARDSGLTPQLFATATAETASRVICGKEGVR